MIHQYKKQCFNFHKCTFQELITVATHAERHSNAIQPYKTGCAIVIMQNMQWLVFHIKLNLNTTLVILWCLQKASQWKNQCHRPRKSLSSSHSCTHHAVFCSFMLDNRKYDTATTSAHIKQIIEIQKSGTYSGAGHSTISNNKDGCAEHQRCVTALYLF